MNDWKKRTYSHLSWVCLLINCRKLAGLYNHSTVPLTREEEELQEMQERANAEKASNHNSNDHCDDDDDDDDWRQTHLALIVNKRSLNQCVPLNLWSHRFPLHIYTEYNWLTFQKVRLKMELSSSFLNEWKKKTTTYKKAYIKTIKIVINWI